MKRKKDEALDKWRKIKNKKVSQNQEDEEISETNVLKNKILQKYVIDEDIHKKIAQWKVDVVL